MVGVRWFDGQLGIVYKLPISARPKSFWPGHSKAEPEAGFHGGYFARRSSHGGQWVGCPGRLRGNPYKTRTL